jgi:two-component system, NtrC family, C4-dicarboxylate transport response regulator DctD
MNITARPTIVIVEDEEVVGMYLRESLEDAGFSVEIFAAAEPALRMLDKVLVGAALIDVGLPDVLGDRLTREIHNRNPSLPVILMTGYDEQRYADAFGTDPYVRVMGKPFDTPRLLLELQAFGLHGTAATAAEDSSLPVAL